MPYYHGTPIANLKTLMPPPGGVIYLTNCRAYALFYIRDLEVNHVTCGVAEDGAVVYDEQFPGQLRTHYAGRCGWLYTCGVDGLAPGSSSWIVTADRSVTVASAQFIPDACEAILREVAAGAVRVKRWEDKTQAQKREITEMVAWVILRNGYLGAGTPKAYFYARSFPEAWALALENQVQAGKYITGWEKAHLKK